MPNLSHQIIIPDVIEKNLLLQDLISVMGNGIPEPVLKAASDLDWAMQQFGAYWKVYRQLKDEGEI